MSRLILTWILIAGVATAAFGRRAPEAFKELDRQLDLRTDYLDRRQKRIDSLALKHCEFPESPALLLELSEAFIGFDNDSALVYLTRGVEMTDSAEQMRFKWIRSSLLPLAGFFQKAENDFLSIEPDSVPLHLLPSYYDSGRQLYSYLSAFFESYPGHKALYASKALEYQQKLLDVLPHHSAEYKYNLGEYYLLTGSDVRAKVLLQEILDTPAGEKFSARAAHHLAIIARNSGDNDSYAYYLARSAIANLKSATREVASLQELGAEVHSWGDISRAHRYLAVAVENAVECGAPLRMIESSKSLPIIERAHNAHIKSWRRNTYWIMACMAVLLIGLGATLFLLHREMKRMSALQSKLKAANYAKEIYISRFLELCSIYMDKLNQFCKISTRKIAAGQTDELFRMVKSGKFVEEQSKEFYDVFDNAFLHLYPGFVDEVNALLQPEGKIELREGERMNTDLRILAFMRLGIDESAKIAQVLNYSLNTIYAYRNRLKARAINRDTFEADIMRIDSNA